jgi:hypothetical protein
VDHGSGTNHNKDIVLLTPDLFAIRALEGLQLIREEKEILKKIRREKENRETKKAVARAAKELQKPLHVPSNLLNGYNLKVFSIFMARFMFQIRLISNNGSYPFVMIPRLQDIVADGKCWS